MNLPLVDCDDCEEVENYLNVNCVDIVTMEFVVDDYFCDDGGEESLIVENWVELLKRNYSDEIPDVLLYWSDDVDLTHYQGKNFQTAVWWAMNKTKNYNGEWFNVGGVKCYHNKDDGTFTYEDEAVNLSPLIGKILATATA